MKQLSETIKKREMKILIIYESQFGNGEKIIKELQEILNEKGQDVEIFPVRTTKPSSLPPADFYIFHSPIRMFNIPLKMRFFLMRFKPAKTGAKYALMTTYLDPRVKALTIMGEMLDKKGMIRVSDGFKAKVLDMKGPLEEGYKERLGKFAEEILKNI